MKLKNSIYEFVKNSIRESDVGDEKIRVFRPEGFENEPVVVIEFESDIKLEYSTIKNVRISFDENQQEVCSVEVLEQCHSTGVDSIYFWSTLCFDDEEDNKIYLLIIKELEEVICKGNENV